MCDQDSDTPSSNNGGYKLSEGDWVCPDSQCGNVNFARRKTCNRCNKERGEIPKKKKLGQEIGKAAAEKSKGLFSADDWQCNKCGNVNWARRQQCNMCNAPKFGEVEERTGLGGGYNDRGVVEYKQRDDSDDEYDEFGRRKKRKQKEEERSISNRNNSNRKEHQLKSDRSRDKDDDDDDDDEDEDDDDCDVSKYDLSDWGDSEPVKSIGSRRSRSRSRSRSPVGRHRKKV